MPGLQSADLGRLRAHLEKHFGLSERATNGRVREAAAALIKSGKLASETFLGIIAPSEHHAANDTTFSKDSKTMEDSKVQPKDVFGGAGTPNVKAPSARYSSKRYEAKHAKTGEAVFKNGAPVDMPSDREHALMGVYFKDLAICSGIKNVAPLIEHERDLLAELRTEHDWCGTVGGDNGVYHPRTKLYHALGRKANDFIATSTSGGDGLVPYFFDQDIVTFPLLSGELFPMVDLRELGTSNQVITPRLQNISATWNGSEGSGSAISLFTTDSLSDKLTSNVYNVAMAITVGRDLLSDSPVNIGRELTTLMGSRLTAELDKVIAIGDGSTQPKGLSQTTGVNTVSSVSGSIGPFKVTDLENMLSSLPKQYRKVNDGAIAWCGADSTWFRIRSMVTGLSGDQRRVLGYSYEAYTLLGRPFKVQNDTPAADLFLGKLDLYRMWRRLGLQIEMTNDGKTNRLNNELLITARGRYAGQFTNGAGLSVMTNAPLH